MLLKRLVDLPPDCAALIPLLGPVRTTEKLIITPREVLLRYIVDAAGLPDNVEGARRAEVLGVALDVLLDRVNGVQIQKGTEVRKERGSSWGGLGVLEDILEWDGRGILSTAGGKGCGKTLLALHATLRTLLANPTATARWVDTEGAFDGARAKAVLEKLKADDNVLDRLTVSRVFQLEPQLFDVLDEIRSDDTVQILVIDTISALFKDALMGATSQAMVIAMEEVAELAYSRGMTAIVTSMPSSSLPVNPLSAFSATTVKPSLGRPFSFTSDIELLLQDTGKVFGLADENERSRARSAPGLRILVEVLKSRVSPSGVWGVVETDGNSLLDVVPPPEQSEQTLYRSAGGSTGRPVLGGLSTTIAPAIAPLKEKRYM